MNADLTRSGDGAPGGRFLIFNGINDNRSVGQQKRDLLGDDAGARHKFALRQQRGGEFSERSGETWALGGHGLRPHDIRRNSSSSEELTPTYHDLACKKARRRLICRRTLTKATGGVNRTG